MNRLRPSRFGRTLAMCAVLLMVGSTLPALSARPTVAEVTTRDGDDTRSGWYPDQTTLGPSLLDSGTFGQLFNTTVDGQVYAQPLVSQGTLFVGTERNNIYGLDPKSGAVRWSRNVGAPWNPADLGCADLTPWIGITGTPVIDPATNTAYFLSKTYASGTSGPGAWFAHGVDVATGVERPNFPVAIQGRAANNPNRTFAPTTQNQRPGLLLMNGVVYAGFAAHCDHNPWSGWIAGISTGGELRTLWSAIGGDNLGGAGIWQSGSGLVSDGPGRIFFATGNGAVSATLTAPVPGKTPPKDLGQSVVRVDVQADGSLAAKDFFAPYDAVALDVNDQDLGSAGPVALPPSFGAGTSTPNLMVTSGKEGYVYLLNRDNLGGYQQGAANGDAVVSRSGPSGGVWGRAGVWPGDGGYVYLVTSTGGTGALNGFLKAYKYGVDGTNRPILSAAGSTTDAFGFGSSAPVITSNGTSSGSALVWVVWSPDGTGANAQLRAYDPVPVNGRMNLHWSAAIGTSTKFAVPSIDANRVYVGTRDGSVRGFGSPVTAPAHVDPLIVPPTVVGQSTVVTARITADLPVTVTGLASENPVFAPGSPSVSLPAALAAGQSITVPITFSPTSAGLASTTLTVMTSSGPVTAAISASGQTPNAELTSVPQVLSLDGVPPGGEASGTITFNNIGAQPATVLATTSPSPPFTVSGLPTSGTAIPANGSLSVTVTFAPTEAGSYLDAVGIDTDAGPLSVPVTGASAAPPQLVLSTHDVGFGNVPIGATGKGSFTIVNPGGTALTITKSKPPALATGFTATTLLPEGTSIPPGGSATETVSFTASTQGTTTDTWVITGDDGSGVQTVTFTANGVPAFSVPPPTSVGWALNGSATINGSTVELTPAVSDAAGSTFFRTPVEPGYLSATFDANIDSGSGADGLAFVLADPARGATTTSLGTNGGGLGFSGIPGIAVALDTFHSPANPSGNFVGLTDGGLTPGADQLRWIAANVNVQQLRNATVHVVVTVANGLLTVELDGSLVLSSRVTLGARSLVGFTAGNGGLNDRHAVSNVEIASSASPPTSLLVSNAVLAPAGSPQLAQAATFSGTCPDSFTGVPVAAGGSAAPALPGAVAGASCSVSEPDPGPGWTTTVSVNGGAGGRVTPVGGLVTVPPFVLRGGQNTVAFSHQYVPPPPGFVPPPAAGGWRLNGAASMVGSTLQLTPAGRSVKASAFWPTPVASADLRVAFDANIDSGTGGEGQTLIFGDPTNGAKATSLGGVGGYLGFGGIPGVAVALDTSKNASDPSANFVGVSTGKGTKRGTLAWSATNTAVPPLRNATVRVVATLAQGSLTVSINGSPVLSTAVALPSSVLVGFGGSTGSKTDRHAVSNVTIGSTTDIPAPTAGGWTTNGSSSVEGATLVLTPALPGRAGSAFWPTSVGTGYLRATFDAYIDSGTGADGLALVLADPAAGATPTSLGTNGGGLGFSGVPGVAVALGTYQNVANPSGNFVGITTGGLTPGSDHLRWLSTTDRVPELRDAPVHVTVLVGGGVLTVLINGDLALSREVVLPPSVLIGFSGGTGGLFDRHAVGNVAITAA